MSTLDGRSGRLRRRVLLLAGLGLLLPVHAPAVFAQRADAALTRERAISVFLVNALYLGQWPASHDWQRNKVARIGVLGRDTLGSSLEAVVDGFQTQRFRDGRVVVIVNASSPASLANCHVVFVSTTDTELIAKTVQTLAVKPIILVSEAVGFAERGGTFEIRLEPGKPPSWDLNLDQLAASSVQVGSQMKIRANSFIQGGTRTVNPFR